MAGWPPDCFFDTSAHAGACTAPPSFPTTIALYQQAFRNWAGEIKVDDVWTCAPCTAADGVLIANWARVHGYAVESRVPGTSYGSLSNLITSLTAVVWDADAASYVLRTFDRSAADARVFLTHLGRAYGPYGSLPVAMPC